ncbi:LamG-like jellyroll fold domain-containing protein, partial [Crocosphaera watsonii]|uniref:LamG-like jellyroll fold domain-containing protein n=1 Tax=Crocosphaera watsonii TaxID=263511 RepID=UPI000651E044
QFPPSEGGLGGIDNSNDTVNLFDNDEAGIEIVKFVNSGAISISDEDAETLDINVKSGTFSLTETGAIATIELNLNSQPTADTTVTLSDVNNPNVTETFTFTPENWDTIQEWDISQENIGQLTEAFDGTLSLTALVDGNQTIELPFLQQAIEVDSLTLSEAGGKEVFGVRLESEPTSSVTLEVDNDPQKLNLEVGDGLNNNLVFDSTNWDSYQRVVIQTVDNQIDTNEDEGFVISNIEIEVDKNQNDLDVLYRILPTETLEVTINDDDNTIEENPDVIVNDSQIVASLTAINNQIDEESGTATLQVNLSENAPEGGIVVNYQLNEQTATAGIDFVNQFQKTSNENNPLHDITKNFTFASVAFIDIDNDGNDDVLVGHFDGIAYFRNTGDSNNPNYVQVTGNLNPFNSLDSSNIKFITPAIADIDNDGDDDVFFGSDENKIIYFENQSFVVNNQFVIEFNEESGTGNPLDPFNVGRFNTPTFGDVDNDGDADLLVGNPSGIIRYYENTGTIDTNGNVVFEEKTGTDNPFADINIEADNTSTNNDNEPIIDSVPTLADIDNDGDLDLFIGERGGVINYFENLGFDENGQLTFIAQNGPDVALDGEEVPSGFSKPIFVDIDNDNDLDAFVGQNNGGVVFYENTGLGEVFIPEGATAEGFSNNFYSVQLATQPLGEVLVTMTPDDNEIELNDEFAGESLTFIFDENNWDIPREVVVTAVDDFDVEYRETTNITFSTTGEDDPAYDGLIPPDVVEVIVEDNDLPIATVQSVAGAIEGDAPGYFVISLDQATSDLFGETGLVVNYSFGGTSDTDNTITYDGNFNVEGFFLQDTGNDIELNSTSEVKRIWDSIFTGTLSNVEDEYDIQRITPDITPVVNYSSFNVIEGTVGEENLPFNNALNFDGVDDFVSFDDTVNISNDYTIEGWFKSSSSNTQSIVALTDGNLGNHYGLIQIAPDGQLRFLHRPIAGISGGTNVFSGTTINDNIWHHFAAVRDGNDLILYIDGNEVSRGTDSTSYSDDVTLTIGRLAPTVSDRHFDGNLDEVRIWNTARTQAEIQDNLFNTLEGNEEGLTAYYQLDQSVDNGIFNNGANINTPSPSPDFANNLSLDGIDDFVTLPNDVVNTQQGTIEHWVKLDEIGERQVL